MSSSKSYSICSSGAVLFDTGCCCLQLAPFSWCFLLEMCAEWALLFSIGSCSGRKENVSSFYSVTVVGRESKRSVCSCETNVVHLEFSNWPRWDFSWVLCIAQVYFIPHGFCQFPVQFLVCWTTIEVQSWILSPFNMSPWKLKLIIWKSYSSDVSSWAPILQGILQFTALQHQIQTSVNLYQEGWDVSSWKSNYTL